MEIVDPRLGSTFDKDEIIRVMKLALLCTTWTPSLRPTMSIVVSILEGKREVEEVVAEPSRVLDKELVETARLLFRQREDSLTDIQEDPNYL